MKTKYFSLFAPLQAFEQLESELANSDVCIAIKVQLAKDSGVANESAYDIIVQKLLTKPRARGKNTHIILISSLVDFKWSVI